jgi:hypothetical protein
MADVKRTDHDEMPTGWDQDRRRVEELLGGVSRKVERLERHVTRRAALPTDALRSAGADAPASGWVDARSKVEELLGGVQHAVGRLKRHTTDRAAKLIAPAADAAYIKNKTTSASLKAAPAGQAVRQRRAGRPGVDAPIAEGKAAAQDGSDKQSPPNQRPDFSGLRTVGAVYLDEDLVDVKYQVVGGELVAVVRSHDPGEQPDLLFDPVEHEAASSEAAAPPPPSETAAATPHALPIAHWEGPVGAVVIAHALDPDSLDDPTVTADESHEDAALLPDSDKQSSDSSGPEDALTAKGHAVPVDAEVPSTLSPNEFMHAMEIARVELATKERKDGLLAYKAAASDYRLVTRSRDRRSSKGSATRVPFSALARHLAPDNAVQSLLRSLQGPSNLGWTASLIEGNCPSPFLQSQLRLMLSDQTEPLSQIQVRQAFSALDLLRRERMAAADAFLHQFETILSAGPDAAEMFLSALDIPDLNEGNYHGEFLIVLLEYVANAPFRDPHRRLETFHAFANHTPSLTTERTLSLLSYMGQARTLPVIQRLQFILDQEFAAAEATGGSEIAKAVAAWVTTTIRQGASGEAAVKRVLDIFRRTWVGLGERLAIRWILVYYLHLAGDKDGAALIEALKETYADQLVGRELIVEEACQLLERAQRTEIVKVERAERTEIVKAYLDILVTFSVTSGERDRTVEWLNSYDAAHNLATDDHIVHRLVEDAIESLHQYVMAH